MISSVIIILLRRKINQISSRLFRSLSASSNQQQVLRLVMYPLDLITLRALALKRSMRKRATVITKRFLLRNLSRQTPKYWTQAEQMLLRLMCTRKWQNQALMVTLNVWVQPRLEWAPLRIFSSLTRISSIPTRTNWLSKMHPRKGFPLTMRQPQPPLSSRKSNFRWFLAMSTIMTLACSKV